MLDPCEYLEPVMDGQTDPPPPAPSPTPTPTPTPSVPKKDG
jgi:hypothetical protein